MLKPVRYTGVNHLAMATRDLEATIRFWRDLLGMRLVAGLGRPGFRHYFFEITPHDMIAFFEWPGVEPIPERDHGVPVRGPLAFDHVAFEVASADDLWELKSRLEAAGFWVSEVIDHGFIHSIYTFDPNNIPIEFSHPQERLDIHRRPRLADIAPVAAAREGSAPQPGHWPADYAVTPAAEREVYPGEGPLRLDDPPLT